jgi:hypothetical protein
MTNAPEFNILPDHFGKGPENIYTFQNFIEKDDIKSINDFVADIKIWDNRSKSISYADGSSRYSAELWHDRMCSGEIIKSLSPDIYNLIDSYIIKMQHIAEEIFNCKLKKRPPVVVCWRPSDMQLPHADKQLQDGRPNAFPDYDLNSLFYYNEDFEGGELYYPQHVKKIIPKAGLAVLHPGDINYLHGVTPVLSGRRWVTPSFYTVQ